MRYDKRRVMLVAHRLRRETGLSFGECLKQAWAAEKSPKSIAIAPQRLPLEAAVIGAYNLAKKIRSSRIEVAGRINVDLGIRITPRGEIPMAHVISKNLAVGFERHPQ